MYETLEQYILAYADVRPSAQEMDLVRAAFKPQKLRKKEFFLRENEVCKYTAFISRGSMFQYSLDEKGNQHIIRFGVEKWWMSDYESFVHLSPSSYNIEAFEDCELLLVTYEGIRHLTANVPAIDKMIARMDINSRVASQKRLHASISMSAEERYKDLQQHYPVLLERFPQSMIASYLGITPETLSRLRKHMTT